MTKFADLKARARVLLEDSAATRFSEDLLGAALRLALDEVNLALPHCQETEVSVTTAGREQALTGLEGCLFILGLTWPGAEGAQRELEPETHFSYFLRDGVPTLHFSGKTCPASGDTLTLRWACGYVIEGFEGGSSTSLPASLESALVNGIASHACYLRAGMVLEAYGGRPGEAARLIDIGRLWQGTFERALNGLKVMQEFGFPPGFALDRWDGVRR